MILSHSMSVRKISKNAAQQNGESQHTERQSHKGRKGELSGRWVAKGRDRLALVPSLCSCTHTHTHTPSPTHTHTAVRDLKSLSVEKPGPM